MGVHETQKPKIWQVRGKQALWFFSLWLGGVLTVVMVGGLIKLMLPDY